MPALDGVRALAVLAVMAYHGGLSFLPAGFFGVDAFFVLSGFLITTLLVTEWAGASRIALRAFWARRARRLLPALLVVLVFVVLYARFVAAPGMYPGLRWDGIAALFYSANWRFIASGQNYFAATGPVSPLLHTWSLAIEEQFYIVWPLVVLAIMRFRKSGSARALQTLLVASVVGALASAAEMALLFHPAEDPTREYFGTDTHAQCLLVGAALAAGLGLWRRRESRADPTEKRHRLVSVGGLLGVGVCAWAWSQLQYGQTFVFRGGFLLVSVSVAAVILSTVLHPTGIVSRVLSWAPLRYIGRISYGMYLWHFPLDIALTGSRTGLEGTPLFLFRTVVTIAVSTVSFYVVERPIRAGGFLTTMRARIVTPAAVIATALIVIVTTVSPAAASGSATPTPTLPAPSGTGNAAFAKAPVRVMLVGDSTALTLGVGLASEQNKWHINIENLSILGCGIAMGTILWTNSNGQESPGLVPAPCQAKPEGGEVPWTTAWPNWLREVRPNLVVLLAGRWEVLDHLFKGKRTNILHARYAAYIKHQLEVAVRIGTSTGAHMVLLTAPCYSSGEEANGTPWPQDNVSRVQAYNRLVKEVGGEYPKKVTVQNLYALSCPHGQYKATFGTGVLRDADGIHFSMARGQGGALLAPILLPEWESLGHDQEADGGHVLITPFPTHFSPP
jgi:peptidoglycan/LPS O-acetylase OafA/YrhL